MALSGCAHYEAPSLIPATADRALGDPHSQGPDLIQHNTHRVNHNTQSQPQHTHRVNHNTHSQPKHTHSDSQHTVNHNTHTVTHNTHTQSQHTHNESQHTVNQYTQHTHSDSSLTHTHTHTHTHAQTHAHKHIHIFQITTHNTCSEYNTFTACTVNHNTVLHLTHRKAQYSILSEPQHNIHSETQHLLPVSDSATASQARRSPLSGVNAYNTKTIPFFSTQKLSASTQNQPPNQVTADLLDTQGFSGNKPEEG